MLARKNCHRAGVLILFMCALVIAGCGKNTDTPKPIDDPPPAPPGPTPTPGLTTPKDPTPEPLAKAKPDVVIPARELIDETNKDYNFVFNKYKGQVVEVSAVVNDFIHDDVFIQGGGKQGAGILRLSVSGKKPWGKVLPTQTVTLRARVVVPFRWEIVDVQGSPPPTLTAEQLVKGEMSEKIKSDWAIVTGVIEKVEQLNKGDLIVHLNAGEKNMLKCFFFVLDGAIPPEQKKLLREGEKVKFLGRYAGDLRSCIVLDPIP